MEKLNRWVAKHVWLASVALVLVVYLVASVLPTNGDGLMVLLAYILIFVAAFLCTRWAFSRSNALLKKPLEMLAQNCDPYPFLEEVTKQKNYPGNWNMKLGRLISEGLALREIGEFAQVYELLVSVRDEVVLKAAPVDQVCYFNEMSCICAKLQQLPEMEVWHEKMLDAYKRIKKEKHKELADKIIRSHGVAYHYARQENEQSLRALQTNAAKSLRDSVVESMNYAKNYYALGKTDEAKEKLEFVVQNGNRLYAVTEAKELLAKINMEEQ